MIAQGAAAAGDIAEQPNGAEDAPPAEEQQLDAAGQPLKQAIGENPRLIAVLEAMGEKVPAELAGGKNGNDEELPASDRTPEGAGSDRPGGEKPKAEGQQKDADKPPEEWPQSAKQRLAEVTGKKNELKARAETAEAKAQQLEEQLKSTKAVRLNPTNNNPLADVIDEKELRTGVELNQELLDFTTLYPHGAVVVKRGNHVVPLAKDASGNLERELAEGEEIANDYSPKQIAAKRLEAERYLRAAPQRQQYLAVKTEADQAAQQLYPEMFEEGNAAAQMKDEIIQRHPSLLNDPNALLLIGDALTGFVLRMQRLQEAAAKNGNGGKPNGAAAAGASEKAKPFLQARAPIAPSTPTPRGGGGGSGTSKDLKEAEERAKANPNDDNAVGDFIGGLRSAQQKGAAAPV